MSKLTPLGLHLSGRQCVVIGGGSVATRRVVTLVGGGAVVTVVAPMLSAEIERLEHAGKIRTTAIPYSSDLIRDAFLVVIATNDAALNAQVAADGRSVGCLVNDADEPERGDCVFPSVVRRGELVISVTTGGASPTLTGRIRDMLESEFGPEFEYYVALLGEVRRATLAAFPDGPARKAALARLASDSDILDMIRDGRTDEARSKAFACISSSSD